MEFQFNFRVILEKLDLKTSGIIAAVIAIPVLIWRVRRSRKHRG